MVLMLRLKPLLLACLCLLSWTALLAAQAKPDLSLLNLTDDQNAAIIEMQRSWKVEQEKQVIDNLRAARQELTQAMAGNSQAEEIRKKFESVQRHYLELQNLKFEKSLRIREILSVDQRRKFQDLRLDTAE